MEQRFHGRASVSPDLLVQRLPDGESVFLHLGSEEYFGLDPVGTRIWTLIESGRSPEDIHQVLGAEYDVDAQRLRHDLDELLGQLVACGFIQFREA
jgi:Coenzyme PQQ synthesis protein D (PqqD)